MHNICGLGSNLSDLPVHSNEPFYGNWLGRKVFSSPGELLSGEFIVEGWKVMDPAADE